VSVFGRKDPDQPVLVRIVEVERFRGDRGVVLMGTCRSEYDGTRGEFRINAQPGDAEHVRSGHVVLMRDDWITWRPGGYAADPPRVYIDDVRLFGIVDAVFTRLLRAR
jgi:hypothetical protein